MLGAAVQLLRVEACAEGAALSTGRGTTVSLRVPVAVSVTGPLRTGRVRVRPETGTMGMSARPSLSPQ